MAITDKVRTNTLSMLLALLLFLGGLVYLIVAFTARDLLFWQRDFNGTPARFVIYQAGEQVEYEPGTPGFDVLARGLQSSLEQGVSRPSGIGLSPQSMEDAYEKNLTVEVFFDEPVKLHAWFDTGNPTRMLFPISGRHSEIPVLFLGDERIYYSSGPVLITKDPLLQALEDLGYEQPGP